MVDSTTEGLLVVGTGLISAGTTMATTGADVQTKLVGLGLVVAGIVVIVIRGYQKDKVAAKVHP